MNIEWHLALVAPYAGAWIEIY
ncbi:hypothetical protein SBF1_4320003 [Candidatus Desulfosporosinus infrequens]|uniref:Uncharacterized protein n=1 Tax=Candidatus Desulfosporosinus infrequens TaxID=2043169 RepID=A0A2U3LB32_9FIRM|nr:hypothetical protein SBF1_4320003 [Candidatus Desulfosporosinus infrequens]